MCLNGLRCFVLPLAIVLASLLNCLLRPGSGREHAEEVQRRGGKGASLEAFVARPGLVNATGTGMLKTFLMGPVSPIRVDELAQALIKLATSGGPKHTLESSDLIAEAKSFVKSRNG